MTPLSRICVGRGTLDTATAGVATATPDFRLRRIAAALAGCILVGGCEGPCPSGMAAIPNDENAMFCIDRFEAQVVTLPGPGGESIVRTASIVGWQPTEGIDWISAKRACEATPAGNGFKHLATWWEWEDAGDGVIGKGGTRFPWGDDLPAARCYLPGVSAPAFGRDPNGPMLAAPTGSFPECRSAAGVYDQIGNAWEWVDPQLTYYHAGALARSDAAFREDGRLLSTVGTIEAQWSAPVTLTKGESGVMADFSVVEGGPPGQSRPEIGWLVAVKPSGGSCATGEEYGPREETERIAIRFVEVPGEGIAVFADASFDGQPIAEKRGGAYYAGADADLRWASRAHRPDFFGSIGFRCASAPKVR